MNPRIALVLSLLILGSMVTGVSVAQDVGGGNESSGGGVDDIRPGERLAGVVVVQEAEIEGDIDERTFGARIANARTDGARAAVLAEQLDDVDRRMADIDARRTALEDRRDRGEIGAGRFAAEVARLAAEGESTRRLVDGSAAVAETLPEPVLDANGVDTAAIVTLRERAEELTGPEVAEIARSIAGDRVGGPPGPDRSGNPPVTGDGAADDTDDIEADIARTEGLIDRASDRIDRADREPIDGETITELRDARSHLESARYHLEAARSALDSGDVGAARAHVDAALDDGESAFDSADEALSRADEEPEANPLQEWTSTPVRG